jgi:UDP-N-acetylglucosamine--N-acetylmuramyl-(pentapeptide) pyrophosphoryl-undecaprenol N-acetylglucosamine transferase
VSGRHNTIVLAAGGTGGHVFPAEALARELAARGHRLAIVTDRRGTAFGGPLGEIETHRIHAAAVTGRGSWRKARAVAQLGLGTIEAARLLRGLEPAAVVGFGGYASVPTMLAARHYGIATVMHEQNAVLGRANRLLAARVDRIATCFERVAGIAAEHRAKVTRTGNPVRPAIASLGDRPYPTPARDGPLSVLVLGGSQGAHVFSTVLPAALERLPAGLRARLRVTQQCREADLAATGAAYRAIGVEADLAAFFADVPERLAGAHLLICRAGASTLAELAAAGRPAILAPYPFATDDHQTMNARALADAGGGWILPHGDFTAEAVAQRLEALLAHPETLAVAARAARTLGVPHAAQHLADLVTELVSAGGHNSAGNGANPRDMVREAAE